MKPEYVGLWRKISEFTLGAAEAELPFSARLTKENEWSKNFAERAHGSGSSCGGDCGGCGG